MKKSLLYLGILASTLSFSACKKKQQNSETAQEKTVELSEQKSETPESKLFGYDHNSTTLAWTAYKTSEKIGVKGTFDKINISPIISKESPIDVLKQIKFNIPVSSTNTGMEVRDKKIVEFFFGKMLNTDFISGSVKAINEDGTGVLTISMNDQAQELAFTHNIEGKSVKIEAVLDLGKWKAEEAVTNLNQKCDALHKGEDGVSKLWPEIKIEINTTLK